MSERHMNRSAKSPNDYVKKKKAKQERVTHIGSTGFSNGSVYKNY